MVDGYPLTDPFLTHKKITKRLWWQLLLLYASMQLLVPLLNDNDAHVSQHSHDRDGDDDAAEAVFALHEDKG